MRPSRASPPSVVLLWPNVVRIFQTSSVCHGNKIRIYIYLSLTTLSNKMKEEQKREILTVWEMKSFPEEFTASRRLRFRLLHVFSSSLSTAAIRKQTREKILGVTTCHTKKNALYMSLLSFSRRFWSINFTDTSKLGSWETSCWRSLASLIWFLI